MKILDANMILRYLLRDNIEMAEQTRQILKTESVLILPEVISEVIYVLTKVYHYDRIPTAEIVLRFLQLSAVVIERPEVLKSGTEFYKDTKLDFVDCLLASYHLHEGHEILTFDKKLQKLIAKQDKI